MRSHRSHALLAIALLAAPLPLLGEASAQGYLWLSADGSSFLVNEPGVLVLDVRDPDWQPVAGARVTFTCILVDCDPARDLGASPVSIDGDGSYGRGLDGKYRFDIYPTRTGPYYVEARLGEGDDALVGSAFLHVYEPLFAFAELSAPAEVVAGETIDISALLWNYAPYDRWAEARLLVDGAPVQTSSLVAPAWGATPLAFALPTHEAGTLAVAIELATGERSEEALVTVLPPARVVSANVTASPLVATAVPLVLHDANAFLRGAFQVRYDPALVEVRSVEHGDAPGLGSIVEHDRALGILTIRVGLAEPYTGNLTLATIEYAAVEMHTTESTLALHALNYERTSGPALALGGEARFHGSVLGAAGDDVLRLL